MHKDFQCLLLEMDACANLYKPECSEDDLKNVEEEKETAGAAAALRQGQSVGDCLNCPNCLKLV